MTIFCDRDNRWYLGFLCGLLLLALGIGRDLFLAAWAGCTGSACGARRNGGAVLLAEGVPETTVAKAFAEENGHSAAAAALWKDRP